MLAKTREWLATGLVPRLVALRLQEVYSLSKQQAYRYVATTLAQLIRDDDEEPMESKRARTLAAFEANAVGAATRTRKVFNPETGEEVAEYVDPDYRASNQSLTTIAIIQGVMKQRGYGR